MIVNRSMQVAKSWDLFVELLHVYLGVRDSLSLTPSDGDWKYIYTCALKQTLLGVAFSGVEKLPQSQRPSQAVLSKWIAQVIQIEKANNRLNIRLRELDEVCKKHSLKSCLLKGQGVANLYPNPLRRQSGDIDLWIRGKIDDTIMVFSTFSPLTDICHHHAHCNIFQDTDVEIHFLPCWMYSPITNRRLQSFFQSKEDAQFANYNESLGVNVTDVSFDLVFSAVHIYRHLFTEGIGLRQLLDYYYILSKSTLNQRVEAFKILKSLKMTRFASALMYVLSKMFNMSREWMYVDPDDSVGQFLLNEIILAGNFGKYDSRITWRQKGLVAVYLNRIGRNFRFLKYFPSETLWAPFWKIWHYIWRRVNKFK